MTYVLNQVLMCLMMDVGILSNLQFVPLKVSRSERWPFLAVFPLVLVGKMGSSSTNKDFVARRAETRSEELGCAWVDIGPWEVEVVFQGERWQVKCLHPPENQQLEP